MTKSTRRVSELGARVGRGSRLASCFLLVVSLAWTAIQPKAETAAATSELGYVGSAACEGCHTYIYKNWKSTRHGSSIVSGVQAQEAGYPLPVARRGGKTPTIRSWNDVAYVIGRRQRIAYIDRSGSVQDTSYHHRIGKWGPFPAKKMSDCGSCHFTAFGTGRPHRDNPAVSGRWVEMNIGCEACHGPGERHVESLEKDDITVNASARLCGQCHTTVGKVLPVDDHHDMHDLVQVWNHDRHSAGTRFQSHDAFCARCHSPYQGHFLASTDGTKRRVFTEHKQLITCIGCHNPHELTNEHYAQPQITLQPALSPKLHIYQGNDDDFTTTDFDELDTIEQVCVQCHRGADRVDLNHANATCIDCHNSFKRNRTLESRVFHDANHRGLSCQPCHRDADHLMTILFRDPDFLEPKYIHNLRTLPLDVKAKYGFQFTELTYPRSGVEPGVYSGNYGDALAVTESDTGDGKSARGKRVTREVVALSELLSGALHRQLAEDEDLRMLQANLRHAPEKVLRYFALALEYAIRGERTAAREIIEHVLSATSSRMLLELPVADELQPGFEWSAVDLDPREVAETLLGSATDPDTTASRLWIQAYLEMTRGQFADAAKNLDAAQALRPHNATFGVYFAVAELGRQRYQAAIQTLESVLESNPSNLTARVALGWVQLERQRFTPARKELEKVLAAEPDNSVANYLLGRGYLNQGDTERAARALEASVSADTGWLDAWFQLARTYRAGGQLSAAARIYEEIVERQPERFEVRYELASVLKLASDSAAFQLQGARENAPPPGTSAREWRDYVSSLERSSRNYGELALSQYAMALSIRLADVDSVHQVSDIYRRSGRLAQALTYFEWLARREPEQWLHHYRLGTVLIQLERPDEAIEVLNRASALAPAEGDPYFALGLAYVRAGRLAEAIGTFQRGTMYEPFNPALFTNLGAAFAITGRYDSAREALYRSLELGSFPLPRLHLTYTNLALVHLAEGRRDEAVRALKTALHVFPEYAHARSLLESIASVSRPNTAVVAHEDAFVFNDFLERFGEVTTVAFDSE